MSEQYDYIIVGGGSAGCVLANRLTEDPGCRVLLLEAGGSASKALVQLSFGFAYMLNNPTYDWRFELGPEPGLEGRSTPYPRGRLLGGSSSINAMLYVRGLRRDYDTWADEGLHDWGWSGVEPYLRKMEDYPESSPNPRGIGGPVKISRTPNFHPVSARIVEAAGQCSIGATEDYNGSEPAGLGHAQVFYRDGRRCGSAAAHLRPAAKRPNLKVITHATVERVLMEGKQAGGVAYRLKDGATTQVRAPEIILSAGAIGSPQLLEVSGIGDAERLKKIGIEPLHHLPAVGEHMQDHCLVFLTQTLTGLTSLGHEYSGWRGLTNTLAYLLFKRGYLNGTTFQVTGHTDVSIDGAPVGLQLMCTPLSFAYDTVKKTIAMSPNPAMMLGVNVCRPNSRGHVHAKSASIDDKPGIVANLLTDGQDIKATVAGLRLCRELVRAPAFNGVRSDETAPGAAAQDDEALAAYARKTSASAYHPVGTCRMSIAPEHGVVDASLRVHGIAGLRVIDASVMPRIVSANTHGPTVMIAEKAADIIKAERKMQ